MSGYLFTSESVTEGHPDKVCDAISDAVLDDLLSQDPNSLVACETLATKGLVVVSGEVTTHGDTEVERIVRDTLHEIGYTDIILGMNHESVKIITSLHEQSPDIRQGVIKGNDEDQGAGDQGLMFGYANNDTPEKMPMPIQLAHRLTEKLALQRKNGTMPWLGPDGKSQVTIEYKDRKPVRVKKIVIATQHLDMGNSHKSDSDELSFIRKEVTQNIILPVLDQVNIKFDQQFIINGTGRFVIGGPEADTGLTGRKIIVDTYGGYAPHGGGAFSGKDPSKVDRSATYMARYIAKNIVAAELASECLIQLSYSIGVAEPTSVWVSTNGTGKLDDAKLTKIVRDLFPLRPSEIIDLLKLKHPRYKQTSAYGHFGRVGDLFTWEKLDFVDKLQTWM
jgi:S-adenosylmethionine synthetase